MGPRCDNFFVRKSSTFRQLPTNQSPDVCLCKNVTIPLGRPGGAPIRKPKYWKYRHHDGDTSRYLEIQFPYRSVIKHLSEYFVVLGTQQSCVRTIPRYGKEWDEHYMGPVYFHRKHNDCTCVLKVESIFKTCPFKYSTYIWHFSTTPVPRQGSNQGCNAFQRASLSSRLSMFNVRRLKQTCLYVNI